MAETGIHVGAIFDLREILIDRYADRPDVFVGTDQNWYWEERNSEAKRAPDIMVAFGVVPRERPRNSFKSWLENGSIPSFICEFSSEKTWRNDVGEKFDLFEQLGVTEYFLFDPEGLYLDPQLQGWRLRKGKYQAISTGPDGSSESMELGVRLLVEGLSLRVIEGATGEPILTRVEQKEREQVEAQRQRERAERAEKLLSEQSTEIARLKALLEAAAKKDAAGQP